jgi:lysophospholipase L1-like esterase
LSVAAPQHLLASALSLNQIKLSWHDASSSESGFEVMRSTTGIAGAYVLVGTAGQNSTKYTNTALSQNRSYCYQVRAKVQAVASTSTGSNKVCAATMSGTSPAVRIVTFGDSNTDWGLNGTAPQVLARSYISANTPAAAMLPHGVDQLAGKIEERWRARRSNAIRAVNHAISGTTTGGGSRGGPNRRVTGAPQALTPVGGITRFEGEVLGIRWPWSGGEPINASYPLGALRRIQAFTPALHDFVYLSMGTNDAANRISTLQTLANLGWMIDRWLAAGKRGDHFILTTLAPRTNGSGGSFPEVNDGIRRLAASKGVILIDLAGHTSADNGLTWRSPGLHVGDGVHYSESVRDWLAERVVAEMQLRVP